MGKRNVHALSYSTGEAPRPTGAWWQRRGTIVALGLALWLGLIFFYVGGAWPMALYRLIVDGGVMLLWLGGAAGLGSILLLLNRATHIAADRGALRFVTAAALGLGAFSLITLGLGLAGWLNRGTAIGLVGIGVIAGIIRLKQRKWNGRPQSQWLSGRATWAWLLLLVVPFIAVMTAGSFVPPGFLWTPNEPHGYDVVEYHLQVPREWYEAGRIIPLHHNVFSFFPFNVELHYLLAMHLRGGPWAGMYLAPLMHGTMILLAALAACGFARRLACATPGATESLNKRVAPVLAGLAMLTTPWLAQLGAIAYDEGGFLLFGTLAIGWAALAIRDAEHRISRFVLAGIMAGLACGAKLTAVPEVLVAIAIVSLVMLLTLRSRESQSIARRALGPIAFGIAGTIVFAPWLARTAAWSGGNPVFPELASGLGHGDFSEVQIERWHHAHTAPARERSIPARLHALGTELLWSWQFGYVLFPLALVSIAFNYRDRVVWFLGVLLLLLLLFWLTFTHLQSRFLILAVPICALLIARLPWFIGVVIAAQFFTGFIPLNREFRAHVRPFPPEMFGVETFEWMVPEEVQRQVPPDAALTLVGDAKAFLWQRPMSRLRYKTIFDADTSNGRGVIDAWAGPRDDKRQWLLIDPGELKRFESYQPFPPVPPAIAERQHPYLIER
jgi:hypothetical protein